MEYKLSYLEQPRPYENQAKQVRLLGVDLDENERTSEGRKADAIAGLVRRHRVEQLLQRFISRQEVRAVICDERMEASAPPERLRLAVGTQIDVERSSYGFPDFQWHCTIDAMDLINLMDSRRWRDQRTKDFDWLLIERYVRIYFETFGCPSRKEDVYDRIVPILEPDQDLKRVPSDASLKAFIAVLRAEYEDSD
jgi:hypothetical protein